MSISTIVLCAGEGTRMKSTQSKVLHDLCGKALCFYALKSALELSTDDVVAVLGSRGDVVRQEIEKLFGGRVKFVEQREQLGTGHAIQQALLQWKGTSSTIMVTYGDAPLMQTETLSRLISSQREHRSHVAVLTSAAQDPFGYGRVIRDDSGRICAIIEEQDASLEQKKVRQVNAGAYAFDGEFLRSAIGDIPKSKKGEFYLTDMISLAYSSDVKGAGVSSVDTEWENIAGVNDQQQLAEARAVMQQRINISWMKQGVSMIDPNASYIDFDVELSGGVVVEPGVYLKGKTSIGTESSIGTGSVITNTHIGSRSSVLPYSVCEEAYIGDDARVGPFCHLRKDTRVESSARVGNFVELKNTTLKNGAKANHLAYLGDAEIGERTNVGAGTITCNYDGFTKSKTLLGDGVFIGSNSTLVAPLEIANGAYVAAGSTIVGNVPKNALALGRARQHNKENYAQGLRERLQARKK